MIAHAAERLPEAVPPLAADDGETVFLFDGHPISLSPFVEGDWLDREDLDQVQASARLLARLHAAMADWRGGPRPPSSQANPGTWDPNDDPPELRDPALDGWWASIAPSGTRWQAPPGRWHTIVTASFRTAPRPFSVPTGRTHRPSSSPRL